MRKIFGEISWAKKAIAFFGSILILSVMGPFGTYHELVFLERLIYWTIIMVGVGFFMHVMIVLALETAYLEKLPQVLRVLPGVVLAALPGTAVVYFVGAVMRPPMPSIDLFWIIWMQVSIIGFVIGCLEYVDWIGTDEPIEEKVQTRFHKRLPPEIGGDIISLSMRDHYVEVTTALGTHLVLMRMSDALNELDGLTGARTHRSHWVNANHVTDLAREGKKTVVRLTDGRSVPVSATYLEQVRPLTDP